MFDGLDLSFVKRLRDALTVKLLLKGIVTREDAEVAVQHGVDGIVVSNHGGRAEESLRPTIESLPEVIDGVAGRSRCSWMVAFGAARTFSKRLPWVQQRSG